MDFWTCTQPTRFQRRYYFINFWLIYHWTAGKALFFFISTALVGMAFVHLITLGVLGELVVGTSDLSHTELPEITKKTILVNGDKHPEDQADLRGLKPDDSWQVAAGSRQQEGSSKL